MFRRALDAPLLGFRWWGWRDLEERFAGGLASASANVFDCLHLYIFSTSKRSTEEAENTVETHHDWTDKCD